MAMTETRPVTDAEARDIAPTSPSFDSILATGDHKLVGRFWIGSGAFLLVAAFAATAAAALEASDLGGFAVVGDASEFVQLWSMGRDALIFAGLVPILIGLATYLVPLQVGSSSLAFPRGAAAAFWSWLASTILFAVAYIDNGGPAGGRSDAVVLWSLALAAMIGSIVWALVCVATTVLGARAPGMSLDRVPVSTWGFAVFSLVGLFILPVVMAQLLMAFLDTKYGYLPTTDLRLSLVSIGNSFSFAPAIYWLSIPTLAMAVEFMGVHTGRAIRFHRSVMAALGLLGVLCVGSILLAFDGRGSDVDLDNGVLVGVLLASILPVVAILGLAGDSLKAGKLRIVTPMIAALLGGLLTLVGVIVGALGTIDPIIGFIEVLSGETIDRSSSLILNGTAFHEGVRAFIIGAALVSTIGALHHWGNKISGRNLSEGLGLLSVVAAAAGTVLWGTAGVVNGFLEAPLVMVDAEVSSGVEAMSLVGLVGSVLLLAASALLLVNVLGALAGRGSSSEAWRGLTLEWATTSPPPPSNFVTMPVVRSATPLADIAPEEQVS